MNFDDGFHWVIEHLCEYTKGVLLSSRHSLVGYTQKGRVITAPLHCATSSFFGEGSLPGGSAQPIHKSLFALQTVGINNPCQRLLSEQAYITYLREQKLINPDSNKASNFHRQAPLIWSL